MAKAHQHPALKLSYVIKTKLIKNLIKCYLSVFHLTLDYNCAINYL